MSDSIEIEEEAEASRPMTEIQIFLIKVAAVTGAVLFLMIAAYLFVSSQAEELAFLKGGHAFWDMAEEKLYKLADAPDLPEAKKAKMPWMRLVKCQTKKSKGHGRCKMT